MTMNEPDLQSRLDDALAKLAETNARNTALFLKLSTQLEAALAERDNARAYKSDLDKARAEVERLTEGLRLLQPCAHKCTDGNCPHDRRYRSIISAAITNP